MKSGKERKPNGKRPYQRPAIIYSRKIEALAATCSTALIPDVQCWQSVPACELAFGP